MSDDDTKPTMAEYQRMQHIAMAKRIGKLWHLRRENLQGICCRST